MSDEMKNIRGTSPSPVLAFRVWEVRDAWRHLKQARESECKCTGFVLQYEGCSCDKKERVARMTETLEQFLEEL